eukprot:TRINITY_DN3287_c0_g1_i6.p1 TRINITY_DN3287_c0_g1~~TRINITY_DN3287_c0_g1_i6.p1  ORF type:complete len:335 (-),score=45.60 TRINITY_DN3287_c0_g1_i6:18-1022(-)
MANNKVMTNNRNIQCAGKQSLLPPKSPFPSISPAYADYGSSSMGPSGIPKARGHRQRQRAPSESFLLEEQPSWLDDLLNEPETPVRRGSHRRSSSDSFAYLEASSNSSNIGIASEDVKYSTTSVPLWGSLDFDRIGDVQQTSFFMEDSSGHHNKSWVSSLNPAAHTSYSFARNNIVLQSPGSSCASGEPDGIPSTATEKRDPEESGSHDGKGSSERGDPAKSVASETDPKRTKQYAVCLFDNIFVTECCQIVVLHCLSNMLPLNLNQVMVIYGSFSGCLLVGFFIMLAFLYVILYNIRLIIIIQFIIFKREKKEKSCLLYCITHCFFKYAFNMI